MNLDQAMAALREAGTAQNRKIYSNHGVGENQFGVSSANLKTLTKKIKTDHDLAKSLWETGNHDARILAMMIADPKAASERELDAWVKDLDNYVTANSFAGFVAKTSFAQPKAEKWATSESEWEGQCGWDIINLLAMNNNELPNNYFEVFLETIELEIHTRKNRVRHAMNMALICIGIRNEELKEKAIAASKRIGKVEVDHGKTGCKTPNVVEYINKTLAYRANRAKK